jgi:flagellar basal body rod protein FlgB
MLERLIGRDSSVAQLKEGLNASSQAVRGIAHRVANSGTPDFAQALNDAQAAGDGQEVDIGKEMVALADEQLRYEAAANLLQKVYQQVRSSIRER